MFVDGLDERARIRDMLNRTADRRGMLEREQRRIRQTLRFDALVAATALYVLAAFMRTGGPIEARTDHPIAPAILASGVDPDTAGWAELAVLPGLGESVGRKIVAYRDALKKTLPAGEQRVFFRASDLQKVSGVGEKTVQRIRAYLRFPQEGGRVRH